MSKRTGPPIVHVISITDPGGRPAAGFAARASRLRLLFFDVDEVSSAEFGPTARDVERVIEFARRIRTSKRQLMIHCEAGISRSTAAALSVFATWLGDGKEELAVEKTIQARPQASPNRRFVQLADELLSRRGRLLRALQRRLGDG